MQPDGQILLTRHDGSLLLVSESGQQNLLAQPDQVPVGQPGLFTNELIGGERLAVIANRLLLGRPDALEPITINRAAIKGRPCGLMG